MIVIPGLLLWLLFVAAETEHSGSGETEDLADNLEVLAETRKTASVEVSNLTVTFPAYADCHGIYSMNTKTSIFSLVSSLYKSSG